MGVEVLLDLCISGRALGAGPQTSGRDAFSPGQRRRIREPPLATTWLRKEAITAGSAGKLAITVPHCCATDEPRRLRMCDVRFARLAGDEVILTVAQSGIKLRSREDQISALDSVIVTGAASWCRFRESSSRHSGSDARATSSAKPSEEVRICRASNGMAESAS